MKSRTKRRLFTLISFAFIVCFIYIIFSQQPRIDMLMTKKLRVEEKIKEQDAIHEQLIYYQSIAGTDRYIEMMARIRLGYVKADDLIFIDADR